MEVVFPTPFTPTTRIILSSPSFIFTPELSSEELLLISFSFSSSFSWSYTASDVFSFFLLTCFSSSSTSCIVIFIPISDWINSSSSSSYRSSSIAFPKSTSLSLPKNPFLGAASLSFKPIIFYPFPPEIFPSSQALTEKCHSFPIHYLKTFVQTLQLIFSFCHLSGTILYSLVFL